LARERRNNIQRRTRKREKVLFRNSGGEGNRLDRLYQKKREETNRQKERGKKKELGLQVAEVTQGSGIDGGRKFGLRC